MARARRRRGVVARLRRAARRPGAAARRHAPRGLDLLVLDAPQLYDAPGNPYVGPDGARLADNWRRFAALAARRRRRSPAGAVAGFAPDIVHAHDWQAGAGAGLPALLRRRRGRSVMTVHNLAFQGQFPARDLRRARPAAAGLRARRRRVLRRRRLPQGRARHRRPRSPPSARPTPRRSRTPGVRHGPRRAAARPRGRARTASSTASTPRSGTPRPTRTSPRRYSARAARSGRADEPRRAARRASGSTPTTAPLFVRGQPPDLAEGHGPRSPRSPTTSSPRGGKLAVLGSGDAGARRRASARSPPRHPGRVGVVIGYDEALAHLMQGGARRDPRSRRASSPAASPSSTACATAACRWWRASAASPTR